METYIIAILFTVTATWAIATMTAEGMILDFGFLKNLPANMRKMLFACPPCMASIYGTVGYIIYCYSIGQGYNFFEHVLFVITVCGINSLIIQLR